MIPYSDLELHPAEPEPPVDRPRWRITTWTLFWAIVAVVVVAWLIVDRAS